jgi:hypothetical protein
MANGNGSNSAALTPTKLLVASVTLSALINGPTLFILREHGAEARALDARLDAMNAELARRTDQRYRVSDAQRDLDLVRFRFSRNEADIAACKEFVRKHEKEEH